MISQYVTSKFCLECKFCCKFAERDSEWVPHLTDDDLRVLSGLNIPSGTIANRKISTVYRPEDNCYGCSFLVQHNNKCGVYKNRPFECLLYPFLINKVGSEIFLAADTNCPYIKKTMEQDSFKEYSKDLGEILNSSYFLEMFRKNPEIIHVYEDVLNISKISI